ncbi:MAG TPA: hypothetical protein VFI90_03490 [Rubrobacter sp.]|nr:hypothetical protein [Rubrobacter sp.]
MRYQRPRRLFFALLVAELLCVAVWVLAGSIWWGLGAIVFGAAMVFTVLFSNG